MRGPLAALSLLMFVVNVSFAGGVEIVFHDGTGGFRLVTCLHPDGHRIDGDSSASAVTDCLTCCLGVAKAMAVPDAPAELLRTIGYLASAPPAETNPADPAAVRHRSIRAPPVLS
ncbi:hypothetical protein [Rhodobium orientis]|uniref:DUF2946 domain-containing protein n=1 Tax=Rhodobium orientis TaxID=34017 RepID=A0A327JQ80_9HYPH|nr:hypothetical protein [Rhodobium orientis]MBK5950047.1 hypothetical protein [Rhodobium orientis]RAI27736.1 hypothetical protein CH339_09325 [Rhodobium orientis]